ncbi:hypothetical protein KCU71_g2695, partial [Aureobasidium melanogenum]
MASTINNTINTTERSIMVDEDSAYLLSIIRVEPGSILVFEDATAPVASMAKTILDDRLVVAVRSTLGTQTMLSDPCTSVQYIGRSFSEQIESVMARSNSRGFHRIVCLGRPDLSSTMTLAKSLKDWEKYLAPGGRIIVEMYRYLDCPTEHWKCTEARYRETVQETGFQIEQLNGVERDSSFLTGPIEIYTHALSIKNTARQISPLDNHRSQHLFEVANALQTKLKMSRQARSLESIIDDLLGGRDRRLFATLRLG